MFADAGLTDEMIASNLLRIATNLEREGFFSDARRLRNIYYTLKEDGRLNPLYENEEIE